MKILFDPQVFSHKFGGVSRYFVELISGLLESGIDTALPIWKTANVYFHENSYLLEELTKRGCYCKPKKSFYDQMNFRGKGSFDKLLRQTGVFNSNEKKFIRYCASHDYDIVHPTLYDPYFLKYIDKKPFVLTIYDMIHEKFPEYFKSKELSSHKEFLARRALAIIAISASTKADIIKYFKISEKKIHVIHLASSMERVISKEEGLKIPGDYILFTGQRWIYKNFERFIRASAKVLISHDLYLVCTAMEFTTEELRLFQELKVSDRIIHAKCSDSLMAALYSNAKLFVFPSLYEGFGIPVIEAFRCGCPVALSNVSSLPEVGGDAAVYFDPYSIESIRDAIVNVLQNENQRSKMVESGYNRTAQFSWEMTVQKTMSVYQQVLKNW